MNVSHDKYRKSRMQNSSLLEVMLYYVNIGKATVTAKMYGMPRVNKKGMGVFGCCVVLGRFAELSVIRVFLSHMLLFSFSGCPVCGNWPVPAGMNPFRVYV